MFDHTLVTNELEKNAVGDTVSLFFSLFEHQL